jgi:hypothetical protein
MSSMVLHDRIECHAPRDHVVIFSGLFGGVKVHPWKARYWSGSWCTDSGHIIRAYLDELLMDEIREARQ